jgi:hypothetical protein
MKVVELLRHKEEYNAFIFQRIALEMIYTAEFP